MPVPVSVRPVRTRIVLSLRISSHDASKAGLSEVWLSAALIGSPVGKASETKRVPPILTNPRLVIVAVIWESPHVSVFMAFIPLGLHGLGGALNGIDDCGVGTTAAQMWRGGLVGEGVLDLRDGRIGDLSKKFDSSDHHPALAVTALRNLLVYPCLLDRVERRGCIGRAQSLLRGPHGGQTFDGRQPLAHGVGDGSNARANFLPIEQHGTRSALSHAAAEARSGQLQVVTQH